MDRWTQLFVLTLGLTLGACGGGDSTPGPPTSPTPPPASQNRAPVINSITASPSFGIAQLTTFSYSAVASDPDGDSISYSWDLAGNPASGPSGSIMFTTGGQGTFRLTVSDSRGATASDSRPITVGSMTGRWTGSIPGYTNFVFDLSQSSTIVTGTFTELFFGTGRIDPAQPGRIDADGRVEMRFKLAVFSDFTFRGQMDSSGRRITGGVFGSGFNGESFVMNKQ
jgi:hypothetical protein